MSNKLNYLKKLVAKPKTLCEFLNVCAERELLNANISASNNSIENLVLLPHTKLLLKNIERVAFRTTKVDRSVENSIKVIGCDDFDVTESKLPLNEKYALIRKRLRQTKCSPFKLVELNTIDEPRVWKGIGQCPENEITIQLPASSRSIEFSCFIHDKQAQEYFYRIQRQRKIWWMQYSANPARLFLSKVESNNLNEYSVSLIANYPFGNLALEHIELLPTDSFYIKESERITTPSHIIRSRTFLEVAAVETVFDSIDAGDFGEMCIHRKIAPYQCSVYCFAKDAAAQCELRELAKYIIGMLSKHNLSIYNDSNQPMIYSDESNLNQEFAEMDAIGIPYGLILSETTLKDGMMKLRCRDTTLSETIHISYLPQYLLQISL